MSNKITPYITSGSDVVIGQYFFLDIIFTSDNVISSEVSIDIDSTRSVGIYLEGDIPPIVISDGGKKGVITVELSVDENISENDTISFYITPDSNAIGFSEIYVQYNARTIDKSSTKLTLGDDYLAVPHHVNYPPKGIFSFAYTTIKNQDGSHGLSGTPINIMDIGGDLDKVDFYAADKQTKLEVRKFGSKRGLIVKTDSDGKLVLYIYAKEDTSAVVNLYSEILGVTGASSANKTLYIIDNTRTNPATTLDVPVIKDEDQGILRSDGSSPTFSVKIPPYDNAEGDDSIFCFIDGKPIDKPTRLLEPEEFLGTYFISLPYSSFPEENKLYQFDYSVIKKSGARLVSEPIDVTYIRGRSPDNLYEKCKVYSSYGADDEKNLIPESEGISCELIANYKNNKGVAGLFVKIMGTDGTGDDTKVPLGSNIYVHVRIRSATRTLDRCFPTTMPTDGSNCAVVGIPQQLLAGNNAFDFAHLGKIYFYYTTNKDDKNPDSQTWQGKINTVPPGPWLDCGAIGS
ncbi:hypothetical protein [Xenorhabdus hominickii]|uniref:Uncharacterized protein n=1 Tax=Xenorhabdus hominickii TaxID=351679 RepID=A0A2G0QFD1_XENHO|nr:hypothetical protein [Xenorhabdus hominickii]AOM41935.1 hypothetical protein A9255_16045 [Xenorhabdus hominickii]PHM57916.1 hypothetical protein Xhom_00919 [Xenorhabdus hominickii]